MGVMAKEGRDDWVCRLVESFRACSLYEAGFFDVRYRTFRRFDNRPFTAVTFSGLSSNSYVAVCVPPGAFTHLYEAAARTGRIIDLHTPAPEGSDFLRQIEVDCENRTGLFEGYEPASP